MGDTDTKLSSSNIAGTNKFRIVLTSEGLAKLNTFTSCGQVVVFFDAVVDSKAKGSSGTATAVTNEPSLTVKKANAAEYTVTGNIPSIYSYALDIKKEGLTDATKASFTVKKGDTDVTFFKDGDGLYHIHDGVFDDPTKKVTHIEPASNGSLLIKGLDAATYTISEISTDSGHELLTSSFDVTLTGNNPVDGDLQSATVSTGSVSASLTVTDGTAGLRISNREALILRTGGAGTTAIYIGAFALLGLAGILTAANLRRREK
ncbi:MAG: prealbumin-like fold domain-containing protein [Lachnospiraceae bacterium]|nr:prealbumin-like fold domain-containing protein [Lachnospiraceae bacterium]